MAAAVAVLLWPAAWNLYPIVFADTGTYLSQAIHFYAGWDRPVFYSVLIRPLHLRTTLWPIIAAQALLMAWLLRWLARVFVPSVTDASFLVLTAALAGLTWLPWLVSEVMPDLFTPLVILLLPALSFLPLRTARRWLLAGAMGLMLATQQSSLPLSLVLGAACILVRPFLRPLAEPTSCIARPPRGRPGGNHLIPGGLDVARPLMAVPRPTWPDLSRSSGTFLDVRAQVVDGRHKAGHDDGDRPAPSPLGDGNPPAPAPLDGGERPAPTPIDGGERPATPPFGATAQTSPGQAEPARPSFAGLGRLAPLLPCLLAALALCSMNFAAHGRFALAPFGNVFLLARVIADGPGLESLKAECPARAWRLCPYVSDITPDSDEFLWNPQSPLHRAGGPKLIASEAPAIILAAVRLDPCGMLRAALGNTARQMILFASGDGLNPWPDPVTPWILQDFPAPEGARYAEARQQRGALTIPWPLSRVHQLVALSGVAACLILLPSAFRRRDIMAGFLLIVLLSLPVNAAITGVLSGPHDRYQARIMWLPPFVATLAFLRRRT